MFDDRERFVMLMALWNFNGLMGRLNADAEVLPVEGAETIMRQTDLIHGIVRKLDGDPRKVAYGAEPG